MSLKIIYNLIFILLFLLPATVYAEINNHKITYENFKYFPAASYNSDFSFLTSTHQRIDTNPLSRVNTYLPELIQKAILLGLGCVILLGVILGVTDKAIFYMDKADLFFCFIPTIVPVVFFILADKTWQWVAYIGIGISIVIGLMVLVRSIKYNGSFFVGLCVGFAKLSFSFLWLLSIFSVLNPGGKNVSEKRYRRGQSLFIFALISGLMYYLINGNRIVGKRVALDRSKTGNE